MRTNELAFRLGVLVALLAVEQFELGEQGFDDPDHVEHGIFEKRLIFHSIKEQEGYRSGQVNCFRSMFEDWWMTCPSLSVYRQGESSRPKP